MWKNSSGVASRAARKRPGIGMKDEQGPAAAMGSEEPAAPAWRDILYILQPRSTWGCPAALGCAARHAAPLVFRYPDTR